MTDLLNCPFCGSAPTLYPETRHDVAYVECKVCEFVGPSAPLNPITAWNRRAVQGQAAESYRQANPLGGPAKVFDAIADAIRSGDPVDHAMRDFGVCWQAAPAARMLTEQELSPITPHCMPDSPLARSFEAIQRRFCEVNGISLSGAKAGDKVGRLG